MKHAALLLLLALGLRAEIATYTVARAAAAPKLDGVLDDSCWQQACVVDRFVLLGKGEPAADQPATRALLTFDDDALYLAFDCAEPLAQQIKATATEADGKTWMDDGVEIFLNPSGDRERYVQLAINTLGVIMDGAKETPDEPLDLSWNSGATAVAKVGPASWQLEVRVPFAALPLDGPGRDWTFHLARNRRVASQHLTSLRSVVSGFHDVAKFDALRGIQPVGYDVSVRITELGQFLRGTNQAGAQLRNWGAAPHRVVLRYGIAGGEQQAEIPLAAGETKAWEGTWPLREEDAGKGFTFAVTVDGREVTRRQRTVTTVPPVFTALSQAAFYLYQHEPLRLELPLNLAGGTLRQGSLRWEVANAQGETVGSGQTLVRSEPAVVRLYWNRWVPGRYTFRCQLLLPQEEPIAFSTDLRLVRNPWGE